MIGRDMSAALAAVIGAALLAGEGAAQQAPVVVGAPPVAAAPPAAPADGEQARWDIVSSQGTAEAYRGYLAAFPGGPHAAEARALLGQLQAGAPVGGTLPAAAPPSPPVVAPQGPGAAAAAGSGAPVVVPAPDLAPGVSPADAARAEAAPGAQAASGTADAARAEAALGLDLVARRRVQLRLNALGFDTRGADGTFGSGTRRAITGWQRGRGYPQTGYLTAAQLGALDQGAAAPGAAAPDLGGSAAGGAAAEAALDLTTTQRRIIQSRLTQLGHDTRGVDGKFGPGTRTAIGAWQKAAGVAATGYLTRADADAILNAGTTPVVVPPVVVPPVATADTNAAAAAELALNLTSDDRRTAQRALVAAGHDTNGVDGQFGSGTRRAIKAWQAARGEPAIGYLSRAQWNALRGASLAPAPAGEVSGAPVGGGATAVDEIRLNLSSPERIEVQTRLDALGYDTRGIDGAFGSATRAAIRRWQGDNALPVSGYLNKDQLQQLRRQRRD